MPAERYSCFSGCCFAQCRRMIWSSVGSTMRFAGSASEGQGNRGSRVHRKVVDDIDYRGNRWVRQRGAFPCTAQSVATAVALRPNSLRMPST